MYEYKFLAMELFGPSILFVIVANFGLQSLQEICTLYEYVFIHCDLKMGNSLIGCGVEKAGKIYLL
jgi:hypothetical protein